eukprot:CAMPEP_0172603888 /NCGR_PEP_ID=MMETSP1068-20121228/24099_1 /TAXON_ID=35684 /ORGANISM="Pseudopedinella elastica, Strain CCMP716" /LENGTH=496 /DNA_ID=CAMNT_0013405767 /DNA_START=63 /DNA_END=1553 /DNA_ORIENTATION=+
MATRNLTNDFAALREELNLARLPSQQRSQSLSKDSSKGLLDEIPLTSDSAHGQASLSSDGLSARDITTNPMGQQYGQPSSVHSVLPPAWVDSVEEVERRLEEMDSRLVVLKVLHRKRLMVTFDNDETAQDQKVEQQARGITGEIRAAERVLKRLSDSTSFAEGSSSDQKIRANIVRTLASRLQKASVSFRRAQKDFLARRSEQKRSADGGGLSGAAGGGGAFDFLGADEEKGGEGGGGGGPGSGMTMEQISVVGDMEKDIAQRDHEINTLVESIEELSTIFKELAVLVIDQGTVLDRIDYNMEQAVEKVEDGVVQLVKAEEYQKSARPRYCICVLLFLISSMVGLLVLKHAPLERHTHDDCGGDGATTHDHTHDDGHGCDDHADLQVDDANRDDELSEIRASNTSGRRLRASAFSSGLLFGHLPTAAALAAAAAAALGALGAADAGAAGAGAWDGAEAAAAAAEEEDGLVPEDGTQGAPEGAGRKSQRRSLARALF